MSVGSVYFSGTSFYSNENYPSISYYSNNANAITNTNWKIDGNKSFKPQDLSVSRGFPVISDTLIRSNYPYDTLKIAAGYNLTTAHNQLANYDSLYVTLLAQNTPTVQITKRFLPGNSVSFSKQELDTLKHHNLDQIYIYLVGCNYSNKTIAGKKFVYELATKSNSKMLVVKLQ